MLQVSNVNMLTNLIYGNSGHKNNLKLDFSTLFNLFMGQTSLSDLNETNDFESTNNSNFLTSLLQGISTQKQTTAKTPVAVDEETVEVKSKEDEPTLQELIEQREELLCKENSYHLSQFVVNNQGMCGMGMGMGAFDSNVFVDLTGDEIVRLNEAINGNSSSVSVTDSSEAISDDPNVEEIDQSIGEVDGLVTDNATQTTTRSIDDILSSLKTNGFSDAAKTADGTGIEFTSKSGQKVKVFDANGDGSLTKSDYDFNTALSSYKTELSGKSSELQKLDDQIITKKEEIRQHKIEQMQNAIMMQQLYSGFGMYNNYGGYSGYNGYNGYSGYNNNLLYSNMQTGLYFN